MKLVLGFSLFMLFGFPAMIVGYIWCMVRAAFRAGILMSDKHSDEVYEKYFGDKE